jgi:hypothetical protein
MNAPPPVFPFGQPLRDVCQTDRSPKRVFVLGVCASAVHARWVGRDGRDVVKALAVASEPNIFWRGDGADEIIAGISVPAEIGRLVPPDEQFNGPSGFALDERILAPLGLSRADAWLCDLVPHSCLNDAQRDAIERAYLPLVDRYRLPPPSIPPVPTSLADDVGREQILAELVESRAPVLVLLGDEPIRWFLRPLDDRWRRLSDLKPYGALHEVTLRGRRIHVLALAHPRQVARLGRSSKVWFDAHETWSTRDAPRLL